MPPESTRVTVGSGPVMPICSAFSGSSANSSRFSNSSSAISAMARHYAPPKFRCDPSGAVSASSYMAPTTNAPKGLTIRTAEDADWPAMALLAATCFGAWRPEEANEAWRTMMPTDSAVVACDGADVVGVALYLDLKLTVPGGAVLPMAGVSWVVVSPTHRRRGVLDARCSPNCTAAWAPIRSQVWRPARQASTAGSGTGRQRCGVS